MLSFAPLGVPLRINPQLILVDPPTTNVASPFWTSPAGLLSESDLLVKTHFVPAEPALVTVYIPFCFASVWFLTRTESPTAGAPPSTANA